MVRNKNSYSKPSSNFARPDKKTKQQRDRILIVCEDSRNSVAYFTALIGDLHLTSANVHVTGNCGSAPSSVHKYAKDNLGDTYDVIYCVFDKDDQKDYDKILKAIKSGTKKYALSPVFLALNFGSSYIMN